MQAVRKNVERMTEVVPGNGVSIIAAFHDAFSLGVPPCNRSGGLGADSLLGGTPDSAALL